MNKMEMLNLDEVVKLFHLTSEDYNALEQGGADYLGTLKALCKSKRRDLLMEYHPDKGGDVEVFKRFQNVYNLLMKCSFEQVKINVRVAEPAQYVYTSGMGVNFSYTSNVYTFTRTS